MILETERMVTDWLKNTSYGVAPKLLAIPVDAADVRPRAVQFIGCASEDERVLKQTDPPKFPALYVSSDGPLAVDGEVGTIFRDGDALTIAIRYITKNYDSVEGVQDTLYTLRAVVRSLRDLLRNENAAARVRNSVLLIACTKMTYGRWEESYGSATVTGAVTATFKVRDTAP